MKGIRIIKSQSFEAFQTQEINNLIVKNVFEFVIYNSIIYIDWLFKSRLINKVKGYIINALDGKSNLVI